MAVDITDLIPSLLREVNPPGVNLYPGADDAVWTGYLQDAFWEARLAGMLTPFTLNGTDIEPVNGTTDMTRDLQQLVVLYAGYRILLTALQNVNSAFKAKAGPVEFEQQKSAQTLKGLLDAVREKIALVTANLSAYGGADTQVFDAMIERSYAQANGTGWWVR